MSDSDIIANNLMKLYDLTLDRRKTLNGQAANLLSFTGIVQTVFLGLLITLATNAGARAAFLEGPNHGIIIDLLAFGFVTFMITIGLAFTAYFERKWVAAPVVLVGTGPSQWREELKDYKLNPDQIPYVNEACKLQLMRGITEHDKLNSFKYTVLSAAYFSLAVSLFLLAIVGFYIIAGLV